MTQNALFGRELVQAAVQAIRQRRRQIGRPRLSTLWDFPILWQDSEQAGNRVLVGSKYSADHEVQWLPSVRSTAANDSPSNQAVDPVRPASQNEIHNRPVGEAKHPP